MKEKRIYQEAYEDAENKIECPHCGFENQVSQNILMQSVEHLLCRRCQRRFPLKLD